MHPLSYDTTARRRLPKHYLVAPISVGGSIPAWRHIREQDVRNRERGEGGSLLKRETKHL